MALHFHSLAIKKLNSNTSDSVVITFNVPDELLAIFAFKQGQNITLKAIIDGQEIRRSYSICSAPFENELSVAIKKVAGGLFSTYANKVLKVGTLIDVMPPTGNFHTALDYNHKKKYVGFAAGSGITPIISIIKTTLHEEPSSMFTLVYNNKTSNSILFFEEIERLKNKYINRFQYLHILSREKRETTLHCGRIDAPKLEALSKLINYQATDDFFICGPEQMIFCVKEFLEAKGIQGKKIHFELFNSPGFQNKTNTTNLVIAEIIQHHITIKIDGRSIAFDTNNDNASILDAALKHGADLPFACKGGVCCTCKAKLIAGEVRMNVHWGLEEEEIAQGYILTCQSHPVTEQVSIDFDVR